MNEKAEKLGHGAKTEGKLEVLIMALLTEKTTGDAYKKAKVSEATGWRMQQTPEFQEKYREARRQAVSQAISQLQQAGGGAVQTLQAIMQDSDSPASARVSAAKAVLDYSLKALETEDLAARIEKLEQTLTQSGGK